MVLSVNSGKVFNKIQYPFLIKPLHHVGIESPYLNIIKVIYERPTKNIIIMGKN